MATLSERYQWQWRPQLRKRSYAGLVKLFNGLTWLLPPLGKLALHSATAVNRPLDYARGNLRINAESWVEYEKRAHSCAKEPKTVQWIEEFIEEGDVVYDIGANVGAYSLVIAERLCEKVKIYAFEPSFSTFSQLSKNVWINNFGGIVYPMYVALAAKTELQFFNYSSVETGTALHGLETEGEPVEFKAAYKQPIMSYRLDDLIEQFGVEPPNHIKLNVDGIECAVLGGAEQTLRHPQLKSVIVELEETRPGATSIQSLLENAGFQLKSEHIHNQNPFHPGPYVRNCVFTRADAKSAANEQAA